MIIIAAAVTKKQILKAKSVNMISFLYDNFPDTIFFDYKTKTVRNSVYDSLVINKHAWYRFSKGKGGDNIQYLMEIHQIPFIDAVKILSEYEICSKDQDVVNVSFVAPERACSTKNIIAYLIGRGLSKDIIEALIAQNLIYEDTRKNVVFFRNTPSKRMCIIKGTNKETSFNKIITEIPHNYWFFSQGINPQNVYVCESPIDAISLYEYQKRADGIYTSMAGLKIATLNRIIHGINHDNSKTINIAVDWDFAGKNFCINYDLDKKYAILLPPETEKPAKDWNDILIN